ncbi:MAG: hypothetical protein HETSPECPRED_000847 [Heterodermia speciosa]|uniref:Uncharacterized protein n=1 Tax=Heterodermia speciosa TaxID=116794 RepID=A0A8H3ERL3_9LECA|nr:MAG: hypothetical protein HETSPECPRED_000847 [Heterodermia speciosa]
MSEVRQKTFGGTYRQFCKNLEDMKDQTSPSSVKKKQEDHEGWQPIHDLETRLIDAVVAIEAQDFFEEMTYRRSDDKFRQVWSDFRELPKQWNAQDNLRKDLDELMQHRDWNREHKCLEKASRKLPFAKPLKGDTLDEWKNEFASASSKRATPETRELTFGGTFRKLVRGLRDTIYLMGQDSPGKDLIINDGWKRFPDHEINIEEAVKKLPSDELFGNMVAPLSRSHEDFIRFWKQLEQLSSGWEERSNEENLVTLIGDGTREKYRDTLVTIDRNMYWAYPWGFKGHAEWKNDYRADPNAIPDPLYLTFGGAWRQMSFDIVKLGFFLEPSDMWGRGRNGDATFWKQIQGLEESLRDNIPKFAHHPLFEHMVVRRPSHKLAHGLLRGWSHRGDLLRSEFLFEWAKLEELSQKWKDTSDIWNDTSQFIDSRGWEKDGQVLKEVKDRIHTAEPKGELENPEWTEDKLGVSEMTNMEFTVTNRHLLG